MIHLNEVRRQSGLEPERQCAKRKLLKGKAYLVAAACNHREFVLGLRQAFIRFLQQCYACVRLRFRWRLGVASRNSRRF